MLVCAMGLFCSENSRLLLLLLLLLLLIAAAAAAAAELFPLKAGRGLSSPFSRSTS
jgi:hypothetical protein